MMTTQPDEILDALRKAVQRWESAPRGTAPEWEASEQFTGLFAKLDEWLSKGGFFPRSWRSPWPDGQRPEVPVEELLGAGGGGVTEFTTHRSDGSSATGFVTYGLGGAGGGTGQNEVRKHNHGSKDYCGPECSAWIEADVQPGNRDISEAEHEAAIEQLKAHYGFIPSSLQKVIDRGGRIGMSIPGKPAGAHTFSGGSGPEKPNTAGQLAWERLCSSQGKSGGEVSIPYDDSDTEGRPHWIDGGGMFCQECGGRWPCHTARKRGYWCARGFIPPEKPGASRYAMPVNLERRDPPGQLRYFADKLRRGSGEGGKAQMMQIIATSLEVLSIAMDQGHWEFRPSVTRGRNENGELVAPPSAPSVPISGTLTPESAYGEFWIEGHSKPVRFSKEDLAYSPILNVEEPIKAPTPEWTKPSEPTEYRVETYVQGHSEPQVQIVRTESGVRFANGGEIPTDEKGSSDRKWLYLCGQIRGNPNYRAVFARAAASLREAGYEVFNPVEHIDGVASDDEVHGEDLSAMRRREALVSDLQWIGLYADGIAKLRSAVRSKGAKAEMSLGAAIDIPIRSVEDWVDLAPAPKTDKEADRADRADQVYQIPPGPFTPSDKDAFDMYVNEDGLAHCQFCDDPAECKGIPVVVPPGPDGDVSTRLGQASFLSHTVCHALQEKGIEWIAGGGRILVHVGGANWEIITRPQFIRESGETPGTLLSRAITEGLRMNGLTDMTEDRGSLYVHMGGDDWSVGIKKVLFKEESGNT